MKLIFGLDIGTTSIGFAAIDYDETKGFGSIRRMGVRIFPEARDPDGTPLNQQRRQKRQARRQLRRRRERRHELNTLLTELGLLPAFSKDKASDWATAMKQEPLGLRKRGLFEALEPFELGRALYHLAQRRHFKGRDIIDEVKPGQEESEEAKKEKAEQSESETTHRLIEERDTTLGAYLTERGPHQRKRGVHVLRKTVEDEFAKLWSKQSEFHPVLRDAAIREQVERIVFFQRPVFWRIKTLGTCALEPEADLAAKGSWISMQRRMLEKLNNLEVSGGNRRPLSETERAAILEKLQEQATMTWGGVRKALKPVFGGEAGQLKSLRFNLEDGGEKHLLGNPLEAKLAKIFGDAWRDNPHKQAIRDSAYDLIGAADYGRIGQRVVILSAKDRAVARKKAAQTFVRDYRVAAEIAADLEKLQFPAGWDRYSTDALRKILPKLEAGEKFGRLMVGPDLETWRDATFPRREKPSGEILDRLPSPANRDEQKRLAAVRNPTVIRTQNELRKVVNNLIDFCGGKPDLIRIELAREVGMSARQRNDKSIAIKRNNRERDKAMKDLIAKGISVSGPRDRQVDKWLLWKECGEQDPYSGQQVGFDDLFRDSVYEIEHIWPRWKSLDNGMRNKTLCHRDWNKRKGQRTPFAAFGNCADEWEAMKTRVWKAFYAKRMPKGKVLRFCTEEDLSKLTDDFTSRQLNDTGYAARQIMAQLKRLWPDIGPEAPVTVQAVSGRVTAHLRREWGLNNILADDGEKTRADHRHHAVDALAIACTSMSMTQRLSRHWQQKDDPESAAKEPPMSPPWATIRSDAEKAVGDIIVSHKVRKKVSGPLHKETVYGDTQIEETSGGKTYRYFVTRKDVASLTKTAIDSVRDETIRDMLHRALERHGGDPKKAFASLPQLGTGEKARQVKKVRLLVKQQIDLMAKVSTGYADLGNNHHIAIYRRSDGKIDFEVVSLFEATQRLARHEPVVRRSRDGTTFVMSLASGEMLEIPAGERKGFWVVIGIWANGQIVLVSDRDAISERITRPAPSTLLKEAGHKISVDPIGRVRPAND